MRRVNKNGFFTSAPKILDQNLEKCVKTFSTSKYFLEVDQKKALVS